MTLKANLSARGIQSLIDGVRQYRQDLNNKVGTMLGELASDGAEMAREECPVRTGELYSSIVSEVQGTTAYVRVNCPYAAFVEFGTGIVGNEKSHPLSELVGWKYDVHEHGDKGWAYLADDGNFYWTNGMKSTPFMYNAAQKLKDKYRR